jgi:hypothetical protein
MRRAPRGNFSAAPNGARAAGRRIPEDGYPHTRTQPPRGNFSAAPNGARAAGMRAKIGFLLDYALHAHIYSLKQFS